MGTGDIFGMPSAHATACGMNGLRAAGDLVARMQLTRGMRLPEAKKYVAGRLGVGVADLSDCVANKPCRTAFHRDVLDALEALDLPQGPRTFVMGYMNVPDGVASHSGRVAAVGTWNPPRPLSGLAHEFMHELGFHHASDACEGALEENGGKYDPWPPDQRGYIQGVGLDKSSRGFPYRIIAPDFATPHWYDIMSYCNQGSDADTWISTRNWTRFVDELG